MSAVAVPGTEPLRLAYERVSMPTKGRSSTPSRGAIMCRGVAAGIANAVGKLLASRIADDWRVRKTHQVGVDSLRGQYQSGLIHGLAMVDAPRRQQGRPVIGAATASHGS